MRPLCCCAGYEGEPVAQQLGASPGTGGSATGHSLTDQGSCGRGRSAGEELPSLASTRPVVGAAESVP